MRESPSAASVQPGTVAPPWVILNPVVLGPAVRSVGTMVRSEPALGRNCSSTRTLLPVPTSGIQAMR